MAIAAVVQMTSTSSVVENLATAHELLARAAGGGAMLAVLPENFALMGRHERDKLAVAEDYDEQLDSGAIQTWLKRVARELKLWLVAGTIPIRARDEGDRMCGGRVAAACLIIDADGNCVARYDKIHLFDVDIPGRNEVYRESATIAPGNRVVVVATPVGRVGLSVCYDVRFPELYRAMQMQGAELFSVPAAFTVPTGEAHWDVLLRARAIENLCYVLASAQVGEHANGRRTYGHSMIVNPWGEVLERIDAPQAGVVWMDVDIERQRSLRAGFPTLHHRRLGSDGTIDP